MALVDENPQLCNNLLPTYCDLNQVMMKIHQLSQSLKMKVASKKLVIQKEPFMREKKPTNVMNVVEISRKNNI